MAAASTRTALGGFLFGAGGMFATMYSTQAILPRLSRSFDVTPAEAGLTVSVLILAVAVGAWIWGPVSDRIGGRRSLLVAGMLLAVPIVGAAVAPTFEALLACRALQGLCMPGLMIVGVPYVMETFGREFGNRVMGYYVAALIVGGLVGRVGVALLAAGLGWRAAIGVMAILPLAATLAMRRSLPPEEPGTRLRSRTVRVAVGRLARNRGLIKATLVGSSLFFSFIGVFSYAEYRLEAAPFSLPTTITSFIFLFWLLGFIGPLAGRLAERANWRLIALGALALATAGVLMTLPASLPAFALGLALFAIAMFAGSTAAQIGVATSTRRDPGVASAMYFSIYYVSGALGGYLPGLAWQTLHWPGVVGIATLVLVAAGVAVGIDGGRSAATALRVALARR